MSINGNLGKDTKTEITAADCVENLPCGPIISILVVSKKTVLNVNFLSCLTNSLQLISKILFSPYISNFILFICSNEHMNKRTFV